jgi:hypothetical protein
MIRNWANKQNLPEPLCKAIEHYTSQHEVGSAKRSITGLIDSPLIHYLWQVFGAQIVVDYSRYIWSVQGQIVHEIMARFGQATDEHVECTILADINGWQIIAHPDYLKQPSRLIDYKYTSVFTVSKGLKTEWEQQVNGYIHMMRICDVPALRILADNLKGVDVQVCAILRDWGPRFKAQFPYPGKMLNVPIWSAEKAGAFLAERVNVHRRAEEGAKGGVTPPCCTDEERWIRPECLRLIKKGNKKSSANVYLDDCGGDMTVAQNKAEELIAQGFKGLTPSNSEVVLQQSVPMRCMEYCDCADFCPYWQASKKTLEAKPEEPEG